MAHRKARMVSKVVKQSAAHPGFKAVAAKIGQRAGIKNPGAVLAAAARKASPEAVKANPRLRRVSGVKY